MGTEIREEKRLDQIELIRGVIGTFFIAWLKFKGYIF